MVNKEDIMGKILLVDDEPSMLYRIADLLEMVGKHTVIQTNSPEEAEVHFGSVELVLTDMQMHGDKEAGLKLIRKMRPRFLKLPMVILSSGSSLAVEAKAHGEIQDYITKSYALIDHYREFLARITQLLDSSGEKQEDVRREDIAKEREALKKKRSEIEKKIEEVTAELRTELKKIDQASTALIKKCPFHHFTKAYQQCEYCGAIAFPA